jgi:hypothetical protein
MEFSSGLELEPGELPRLERAMDAVIDGVRFEEITLEGARRWWRENKFRYEADFALSREFDYLESL